MQVQKRLKYVVVKIVMSLLLQLIHVQDVRIHASSILIKRLLVGMLDAWVNVSSHVVLDVPNLVEEDVLETHKNMEMIIRAERVRAAHLHVQ